MADLRYLLAIYVHAHQTGNSVPPHIDAEAIAALADGPAVPDSREPASVTGQPSDEAWDALVERAWDKYQTVGYQGERFMYDRDFGNALEFVRQGLARWGNPAPQPVPVSERLPGPEDCAPWPGEPNAGLWCWMASCVDNGWAWEQRTLGFLASFPQDFTHWLPAHALPIPHQQENANDH